MNTMLMLTLLTLALVVTIAIDRAIRYRLRKALTQRLRAVSTQATTASDQFLKQSPGSGDSIIEQLLATIRGVKAVEQLLTRSGTEQSVTQFVTLALQVSVGTGVLVTLATGSVLIGGIAGLLAGSIFPLRLKLKSDKRRMHFENQLPEALDFIARALRAGHGLTMAIGMVGDELPAPIGPEFKLVFDEVNFGIPFDDAISNISERINSTDLNFFIISTKIHRETGGNFTEILESISKTIRERIKLQGRVRTLSAEGKFSGVLLGVLPFVVGGLMTLVNPDYMSELWFSEKGQDLVVIGLLLIILGFASMWNIAKIEV